MVEINKENAGIVSDLVIDKSRGFILSFLQGHMGTAWVDSAEAPTICKIIVGNFCFLFGNTDCENVLDFVKHIPNESEREWYLVIPTNESLAALVEEAFKNRYHKYTRYTTKKGAAGFDTDKLQSFIDALPPKYEIKQIDEHIYNLTFEEEWSNDMCRQFDSYEDYKNRGIGYVITHNGRLVCGASAYCVFDGGMEGEIGTKKEYGNMGFSRICGAKLLLECIKKGIRLSCDSTNKYSLAIAIEYGYEVDKEYEAYEILEIGQ